MTQYDGIKVGETRTYHECGNRGKVLVLAIDHDRQINGQSFTAIKMRALEEIGGSAMIKPIQKDNEWESDVVNGEGGGYAGWYLE